MTYINICDASASMTMDGFVVINAPYDAQSFDTLMKLGRGKVYTGGGYTCMRYKLGVDKNVTLWFWSKNSNNDVTIFK